MQPDRTYLSVAETAKLVRKALKADFPGIKFSVRSSSYAGGASISVRWTDGPTSTEVDRKTLDLYSGASFDGMIDLKSYHDSLLMTEDGPVVVHFGADYVHSGRNISDARIKVYRKELERFVGRPVVYSHNETLPVSVCSQTELVGHLSRDDHRGGYVSSLINQMAQLRPWRGERCPGSETSYCEGCGRWQKDHEKEPHLR